jgi:biopolymer transport protein ExbD
MAMNIGSGEADEDEAINSINTTPLVDVMLVLLIIFLITIPVVANIVPVTLPKESNISRETEPKDVTVSVSTDGGIYWNELRLKDARDLTDRLKKAAVQLPQPKVHIRGDAQAKYMGIGKVVLACQRAGITKIAFVIEPPPRG